MTADPAFSRFRRKLPTLWLLFATFFRIAALVVGGGLAMLPVIEETFVDHKKLLSHEELLEMTALAQTVPGIIAVNCSIYVGMKTAGLLGMLAATAGAVLPSFLVIVTIAALFPHLNPQNPWLLGAFAGVRACVTGLVLATAIRMLRRTLRNWMEALLILTFLALVLTGIDPAYVILGSIPIGLGYLGWERRRMKRATSGKAAKDA